MSANDFNSAARTLEVGGKSYRYFNLQSLEEQGLGKISKLPFSIKVLLEAAVRQFDGRAITQEHVKQIAGWSEGRDDNKEIPFIPARIVLQDFTGVPVVVDLAAMRDTVKKAGGDPKRINPLVPVDLVIDHSVMVDAFGSPEALEYNMKVEFERNEERYRFLRWAQTAFDNFRAVPPATGIVHQVNLEYLASVAATKTVNGETFVFPDSLVGTDSHTTMINGLGVVGWGVGGIEAEAGMLGQPLYFVAPEVIGFKLTGSLAEGATATDLALTVTQMLRKKASSAIRRVLRPGPVEHQPGRPRYRGEHGSGIRRDDRLLPGRPGDAVLPAQHRTLRGANRARGSLLQSARHVPHGRHGRSGVHRPHRARPQHGRTKLGRTETPAGPHRIDGDEGEL
ncbi:hypothetical protein HMSSN036_83810 [Paenibacillus macerans]|nr:hypothetical protein HMSSN036_83810 [Paenibacillus macerans]